jgi:hypothetical protein
LFPDQSPLRAEHDKIEARAVAAIACASPRSVNAMLAYAEDHLLFNEYYHGETGAGLGASHQTGWSGLIALLLHPHRLGLAINGVSTFATRHPEGP